MRRSALPRWAALAAIAALAACSPETTSPTGSESGLTQAGGSATGWRLVAPGGSGPTMINASAHAPTQRAIYAAYMPDFGTGSLWRFDLRSNRWRQLATTNWPSGKYRNLVYDPTRRRLLTYWDGLGQVYAIPDTGGTWTAEGSAPNLDTYYEGYAFFNPASRRLTVFAGYGFGTWQDLLWEWDAAGNAWQSLTQSTPRPEPRFGHGPSTVAVDPVRLRAFLGQRSLGTAPGNYDDLWQLDLRSNTWTNLIPPSTEPWARLGSAMAWDAQRGRLYRFGGCSPLAGAGICATDTNELLVATPGAPMVRWSAATVAGTLPAGRILAGLYVDGPSRRLILVSGLTGSATGNGVWQDDVWSYKLP